MPEDSQLLNRRSRPLVPGQAGTHLAEEDVPEEDPEAELEADDLELDLEEDLLVPAELESPPEPLAILATALGYQQRRGTVYPAGEAARSAEGYRWRRASEPRTTLSKQPMPIPEHDTMAWLLETVVTAGKISAASRGPSQEWMHIPRYIGHKIPEGQLEIDGILNATKSAGHDQSARSDSGRRTCLASWLFCNHGSWSKQGTAACRSVTLVITWMALVRTCRITQGSLLARVPVQFLHTLSEALQHFRRRKLTKLPSVQLVAVQTVRGIRQLRTCCSSAYHPDMLRLASQL